MLRFQTSHGELSLADRLYETEPAALRGTVHELRTSGQSAALLSHQQTVRITSPGNKNKVEKVSPGDSLPGGGGGEASPPGGEGGEGHVH